MSARVHVNSIFSDSIGYGQVGISLVRALMRRGYEVTVEPSFVLPPIPRDVAMLFTVQPKGPFDLYISSAPPMQMGVQQHFKDSIYKSIAWTMWEWSKFPDDDRWELQERMKMFDHVVAYDADSKAALETLETGQDVKVVQGGVETDFWAAGSPSRDWGSEKFIVGMAGIMSARKDPYVAMRVVQRLADEGYPVELWIKCGGNELAPGVEEAYPCLKVFKGQWTAEQMRVFFGSLHAYVGPSWGEGLNLPAVEAGVTGAAVLVSDCDGHRQWAALGAGILLPTKPGRFEDDLWHVRVVDEGFYERLKPLVEDRSKARAQGEQAARIIPAAMNWDRVLERLFKAVE